MLLCYLIICNLQYCTAKYSTVNWCSTVLYFVVQYCTLHCVLYVLYIILYNIFIFSDYTYIQWDLYNLYRKEEEEGGIRGR